MGVDITWFGSGRGDELPGLSGKPNGLLVLYIGEFSTVDQFSR